MIIYVVRPGDSLYSIARRHGLTVQKIINDNELENPGQLVVGQSLVLMTDNRPHTVARGESLYSIARANNITLAQLMKANPQIPNPQSLHVGQVINIPNREQKLGTIYVNGYAFPNIDRTVLNKTLPNLTYLSIFAYEVQENGSLNTIPDDPLIAAARNAHVAPMMVITNIAQGQGFSSDLAHTILSSAQVQQNLINNIINTLRTKNYYGLDIDFEYIYPADGNAYDQFLRTIAARLKPLGYTLTTAIAPKNRADEKGLLYEAHRYPVHGQYVDHVIIMTYEWGYTFGEAQAVAPIHQVRRVLDYAVTAIPSEKILMGMPNYGYDWTLPFVQGSRAKTLTNTGALDLARREQAAIDFDNTSQAPLFRYADDARKQHVVWFDDARSTRARLRLVNQYDLGGVSYWTIGSYFPQNWLILNSMYDVRKLL